MGIGGAARVETSASGEVSDAEGVRHRLATQQLRAHAPLRRRGVEVYSPVRQR